MNELMTTKIDELMQREFKHEMLDESCSRRDILESLKTCLRMAQHNYTSYRPDENEPSHYRIAAQQTLYVFEVLHIGLGLSDTNRAFDSAFKELLNELLAIVRNSEA